MLVIYISGFAAIGALSRWGIYRLFNEGNIFLATLAVNLAGSFVAGFMLHQFMRNEFILNKEVHLGLVIGFLGAFTTFSALSADSLKLIMSNQWWLAGGNVIFQTLFGIVACYLGFRLSAI